MSIAPEGRPFVAASVMFLAVLIGLAWWRGGWWIVPAVLWCPLTAWVPWFFRDPARNGPRGDGIVLAPADGRVVSIVEVDEPTFLERPATRVSVFMNVFDVHVNRHPVSGTVNHRHYRRGRFFNATLDKASEHNEQVSLGVHTVHGTLLIRQIAGLLARRIVTDPQVGEAVHQGERLGMIRFGSRVDTFLPREARVRVSVGDRTKAGLTIVAEWPQ